MTILSESIEQLLAHVGDQVSVSADRLQDRLLDLWGDVGEGPARTELERWITETLGRSLYTLVDVRERLAGIEALSQLADTSA